MKTIIHKIQNTEICIYENDGKILRGGFFKDKPEVGDVIMSHVKKDVNWLQMFEVKEILENSDHKINPDCNYNPTKAYFKLRIEDVTENEAFSEIDNSTRLLY